MKEYRCSNCDSIGHLVSVETEVHFYTIYPDKNGKKHYEGYSDMVDGQFEHILCTYCHTTYSQYQLEEMVIDVGEEE